jgi:hypothetical protein
MFYWLRILETELRINTHTHMPKCSREIRHNHLFLFRVKEGMIKFSIRKYLNISTKFVRSYIQYTHTHTHTHTHTTREVN